MDTELEDFPIVKVLWMDSVNQAGWHKQDEIETFELHKNMVAIGFLTREDDNLIVISSCRGHYHFGNSVVIPKNNVFEMIYLGAIPRA